MNKFFANYTCSCLSISCIITLIISINSIALSPAIRKLYDLVLVDPNYPSRLRVLVSDGVSKGFVDKVKQTLRKIPSHIKNILSDSEEKVIIAKRVVKEFPELKGVIPRGWKCGTWTEATGIYKGNAGIVVAEEYYDRILKQYLKTDNGERILRHEMGHALFYILRDYYETNLQSAYEKDILNLSEIKRKDLNYYWQDGDEAGLREAFAETFAALTGGGCEENADSFLRSFHNLKKCMKRILGI